MGLQALSSKGPSYALQAALELKLQKPKFWATSSDIRVLMNPRFPLCVGCVSADESSDESGSLSS